MSGQARSKPSAARNPRPRRFLAAEGRCGLRSILFVELLGGLGDLLLALPAIHALARSHPEARLTVLTFAPGAALLAADPWVAEVVVAEPGPPEQQGATVAEVAARGFDLAVSDTRYGGIPDALCSATLVVDDLWRGPLPGARVDLRFLRLLAQDGWIAPAYGDLAPRVTLTRDERARATALLDALRAGGRPAVLLLPEAGMAIKEWAPQRFSALAHRLVRDGCAVLVAAARPALARTVAAGVDGAVPVPALALRDLAALAAACAACVAGDTGPARLAASVGTPTVALYGPTWAGRFGLREEHVSLQSTLPCHVRDPADQTRQSCWYSGRCVFDDRRTCTDDITVAAVHAAVRVLLAGAPAAAEPGSGRFVMVGEPWAGGGETADRHEAIRRGVR